MEILRKKAKNKKFLLIRSVRVLDGVCPELPNETECFKFVSHGNFASVSFVALIASHAIIRCLHCSTFHVGEKEFRLLAGLHEKGRLEHVKIVTLSTKRLSDKNTFDPILNIASKYGWEIIQKRNHSKVFLFDTNIGKYVLETSSNLNENPKTEQYSLEKDSELYDFYLHEIFEEK